MIHNDCKLILSCPWLNWRSEWAQVYIMLVCKDHRLNDQNLCKGTAFLCMDILRFLVSFLFPVEENSSRHIFNTKNGQVISALVSKSISILLYCSVCLWLNYTNFLLQFDHRPSATYAFHSKGGGGFLRWVKEVDKACPCQSLKWPHDNLARWSFQEA